MLRAIENRKIRRVGGTKELSVDVRIVAATNMDLEQMANESRFRRDLYYRLNVVGIAIPPLRRRREDIPLLVDYFFRTISARMGRQVPAVSRDVIEELRSRAWPGNVRELQNVVERALATTLGANELTRNDLGISSGPKQIRTLSEMVEEFEADVIRRTLIETEGNQTWAAQRLGVHRNALVYKINRYRLHDLYPEIFRYYRRKK